MTQPMEQFQIVAGYLCMIDTSRYDGYWGFWKPIKPVRSQWH